MMPYKAQVSNASRLGATRIAVPFERNRRVVTCLSITALLHEKQLCSFLLASNNTFGFFIHAAKPLPESLVTYSCIMESAK